MIFIKLLFVCFVFQKNADTVYIVLGVSINMPACHELHAMEALVLDNLSIQFNSILQLKTSSFLALIQGS